MLLQQDADATLLKNKRPFTLLNAVYKIWAKTLQLSDESKNLGETFILLIIILYRNACTTVRVNKSYSKVFPISRSVRQGCPLSLLLFKIAIQVLTDDFNFLQQQGQTKTPYRYLLNPDDQRMMVAALQWKDKSSFLTASNSAIPRIASANTTKLQARLTKWIRYNGISFTKQFQLTHGECHKRKEQIKIHGVYVVRQEWLKISRISSGDAPQCSLSRVGLLTFFTWPS
ncbi:hypothetical protein R1sor_011021 [Riccia sorocarpa]|uniref:Reverse transcriptase domain-containing protein n=1 Tax=Riccia sorocarpa TaxID=122646 RepID=A0ABD3HZP4_9MARC